MSRVRAVLYTGTIESYNELVDYLQDKTSDVIHIWNVDEDDCITSKFTGVVRCAKSGRQYKPGDTFFVELKEDEE